MGYTDKFLSENELKQELKKIESQLASFELWNERDFIKENFIVCDNGPSVDSHPTFYFENKKYKVLLPREEDARKELIAKVEHLCHLSQKKQSPKLKLQAKKQEIVDALQTLQLHTLKAIQSQLLAQGIHFIGFNTGSQEGSGHLNELDSLLAVLIGLILERTNVYEFAASNPLDPLIEKGLIKIKAQLANEGVKETDLAKIMSILNTEYQDEAQLASVCILNTNQTAFNKGAASAKGKKIILWKANNVYLALHHDKAIKIEPEIQFSMYFINVLTDSELLLALCSNRVAKYYQEDLAVSDKLADCYKQEMKWLEQLQSFTELTCELGSYLGTQLFYYLSHISEQERALLFSQEELAEKLSLLKEQYRFSFIQMLKAEQERRNQQRLANLESNKQLKEQLLVVVAQNEQQQRELQAQLNKTQLEIDKQETDLAQLKDKLAETHTICQEKVEKLEQDKAGVAAHLESLNKQLQHLEQQSGRDEREIGFIKAAIEIRQKKLVEVEKDLEEAKEMLETAQEKKADLEKQQREMEINKVKASIKRERANQSLDENQEKISQANAWVQFIHNVTKTCLTITAFEVRGKIIEELDKYSNDLPKLYQALTSIHPFTTSLLLFDKINRAELEKYINSPSSSLNEPKHESANRLYHLILSLLGPIKGELVNMVPSNGAQDEAVIKKYKVSSNGYISYQEVLESLKNKIEEKLKEGCAELYFGKKSDEKICLLVKSWGINSLKDLPQEIQPLVYDKIKIRYPQHDWDSITNKKGEQAVEQLNQLAIDYKEIVNCYVDEIEIITDSTFCLDTSDYYPGLDLTVMAEIMRCGTLDGKEVTLSTSGRDAEEFKFPKASDGLEKRKYKNKPEGDSGYAGEFGRDGQHAGNIILKIAQTVEQPELLTSIELNGGKGANGQYGGEGDEGYSADPGKNGSAQEPEFGGGQTAFSFGKSGGQSGDGGDAGLSGKGGRGGKAGEMLPFEHELLPKPKDSHGNNGHDPDLNASNAPRGGRGGKPSIIGMDHVNDKKNILNSTESKYGALDTDFILQKNPQFKEQISKKEDFGNVGGLYTYGKTGMNYANPVYWVGSWIGGESVGQTAGWVANLIPQVRMVSIAGGVIGAGIGAFYNRQIEYRFSLNQEEYHNHPRRDTSTQGKSKEDEKSQYRAEDERGEQVLKRGLADTQSLEQSLKELRLNLNNQQGEQKYAKLIEQLNVVSSALSAEMDEYVNQEQAFDNQIAAKQQEISVVNEELSRCQQILNQLEGHRAALSQDNQLKSMELIQLIQNKQSLRDSQSQKKLQQAIALMAQGEYETLSMQYQKEFQDIKALIVGHINQQQQALDDKKEEKLALEKKLAELSAQQEEYKSKLHSQQQQDLALGQQQIILTEEMLDNTQQRGDLREQMNEVLANISKPSHMKPTPASIIDSVEPFFAIKPSFSASTPIVNENIKLMEQWEKAIEYKYSKDLAPIAAPLKNALLSLLDRVHTDAEYRKQCEQQLIFMLEDNNSAEHFYYLLQQLIAAQAFMPPKSESAPITLSEIKQAFQKGKTSSLLTAPANTLFWLHYSYCQFFMSNQPTKEKLTEEIKRRENLSKSLDKQPDEWETRIRESCIWQNEQLAKLLFEKQFTVALEKHEQLKSFFQEAIFTKPAQALEKYMDAIKNAIQAVHQIPEDKKSKKNIANFMNFLLQLEPVEAFKAPQLGIILLAIDFNLFPDPFGQIRIIDQQIKENEYLRKIIRQKYSEVCHSQADLVNAALTHLSQKLENKDEIQKTIDSLLALLSAPESLQTNQMAYYQDLKDIISKVNSCYEQHLNFDWQLLKKNTQINAIPITTIFSEQGDWLAEVNIEDIHNIELNYKNSICYFEFSAESDIDQKRNKLQYLFFVEKGTTSAETWHKVESYFQQQLQNKKRDILAKQFYFFLNIQEPTEFTHRFFDYVKMLDVDSAQAEQLLFHIQNNVILFKLEDCPELERLAQQFTKTYPPLSEVIGFLLSFLYSSAIKETFKTFLAAQEQEQISLNNTQKQMIADYEKVLLADEFENKHHAKGVLRLYLKRLEHVLMMNYSGDLDYAKRKVIFAQFASEKLKDKKAIEIELLLANTLNQEVFGAYQKAYKEATGKKVLSMASISAYLGNDELEEKKAIVNSLCQSLEKFTQTPSMVLVIKMAKQLSKLLLCDVRLNQQRSDAFKEFLNGFSALIEHMLFVELEDQNILSDLAKDLDIFIEKRIDAASTLLGNDLLALKNEIEQLKNCLNYKTYKINNYSLLTKENAELEQQQSSSVVNFYQTILAQFNELLLRGYLLGWPQCAEALNNILSQLSESLVQPSEAKLKEAKKLLSQAMEKFLALESAGENNDGILAINSDAIRAIVNEHEKISSQKSNVIRVALRCLQAPKTLYSADWHWLMRLIEQYDDHQLADIKDAVLDYFVHQFLQETAITLAQKQLKPEMITTLIQLMVSTVENLLVLRQVLGWSCQDFISNCEALDLALTLNMEQPIESIANSLWSIVDNYLAKELDEISLLFDKVGDTNLESLLMACLLLLTNFSPFYWQREGKREQFAKFLERFSTLKVSPELESLMEEGFLDYHLLFNKIDDADEIAAIQRYRQNQGYQRLFAYHAAIEQQLAKQNDHSTIEENRIIKIIAQKESIECMLSAEEKYHYDIIRADSSTSEKLSVIFTLPITAWYEELWELHFELLHTKLWQGLKKKESDSREEFIDCLTHSRFLTQVDLVSWFSMMETMATKLAIAPESLSVLNFSKIISYLADFEDLALVQNIMLNQSPNNWYADVLFARLNILLTPLLTIADKKLQISNGLLCLKLQLPEYSEIFTPFWECLGNKVLDYQDNPAMCDQELLAELIELVNQNKSYLRAQIWPQLSHTPLATWVLRLKKQQLASRVSFLNDRHSDVIQETIDYLYTIQINNDVGIFNTLIELLNTLKLPLEKDLKALNTLLEKIAYDGNYSLDTALLAQLENKTIADWQGILLDYSKQDISELNIDRLLQKMRAKTADGEINVSIKPLIAKETQGNHLNLEQLLAKVQACYDKEPEQETQHKCSVICKELPMPIKYWSEANILQWATELKKERRNRQDYFSWDRSNQYLPEIMAVLKHTATIYKKFEPRNTQLIALALFLEPTFHPGKGRLANISTGEGKSLISAMLAAAQALIGCRVDIVTSSKVLAIRDASDDPKEGYQKFFALLGLKASNNCDELCDAPGTGEGERKKRYQDNDIIYGESSYFQRDLLLTHFFGKDIRNAVANSLVVDEVDNMFIDNAEKTLYISHAITDMRYLRDLFIRIWLAVHGATEKDYCEENVNKICDYIQQLLEADELKLPQTLRKFVDRELKTWVENAYYAKDIDSNDNYIIGDHESKKQGEILIMDKDTGVEQMSSRWSQGLHQFLQLKHGAKLSDESLKAVFMSNMNFFKRYQYLNGMTGSIGDKPERALFSKEYQVACYELPRYKKYRFAYEKNKERVCATQADWLQRIRGDITEKMPLNPEAAATEIKDQQADKRRAVLIICENVAEVESLAKALANHVQMVNKIYVYDRAYRKFEGGELQPGDIVIATNIAGRGTDLAISDTVEANGGLHVILSYMPANKRVSTQAFGRTARAGRKGTGVYIVKDARKVNVWPDLSIDELLEERDNQEQEKLNRIAIQSLPKINIEDKLFNSFQDFKHQIESKLVPQKTALEKLFFGETVGNSNKFYQDDVNLRLQAMAVNSIQGIIDFFDNSTELNKDYVKLQLQSLQNHWAFWLNKMNASLAKIHETGEEPILDKFEKFKEKMNKLLDSGEFGLIVEPAEIVKLGRLYLDKRYFDRAQVCFDKLIEKHPKVAEIGHYYKAFCILQLKGGDLQSKKEVKAELKLALGLLEERRQTIFSRNHLLSTFNQYQGKKEKGQGINYFFRQNEGEAQLLSQHINAIEQAIGYQVSTETFRNSGLSEGESSKIYQELIREPSGVLKDWRISKKVFLGYKVLLTDQSKLNRLPQRLEKVLTKAEFEVLGKKLKNAKFGELDYRLKKVLTEAEFKKLDDKLTKAEFEALDAKLKKILTKAEFEALADKLRKVLTKAEFEALADKLKKVLTKAEFEALDDKSLIETLKKEGVLSELQLFKKEKTGDAKEINIPMALDYDREQILIALEKELNESEKNGWDYTKRKCQSNAFTKLMFGQDKILEAVANIVQSQDMLMIKAKGKLAGTLSDAVYQNLGENIKKILLGEQAIQLRAGDSINLETFLEVLFSNIKDESPEPTKTVIRNILKMEFGERVVIAPTLRKCVENRVLTQLQEAEIANAEKILNSLKSLISGREPFRLTTGDVIAESTLIEAFKTEKISGEQARQIVKTLSDSEQAIEKLKEYYLKQSQLEIIDRHLGCLLLNEKEPSRIKVEQLDFSIVGFSKSKSESIKEKLLQAYQNHELSLTAEDFELNANQFAVLKAILQDNQFSSTTSVFNILAAESADSGSTRPSHPHIEDFIMAMYESGGGRVSEKSLALPSAEELSKKLWLHFNELGLIKAPRVDFKFTADPENRKAAIKHAVKQAAIKAFNLQRENNALQDLATTALPQDLLVQATAITVDWMRDLIGASDKRLDHYIDTVTEALNLAAGSLRTLPKVQLNQQDIARLFSNGQVPPELMDYVQMSFDSVLSLKEQKGFFSADELWCIGIGVAQIALGVALEIYSGGTCHFIAQALISEGIGDIVFVIQSKVNGNNFSWQAYRQHKVISVVVSLLTAGVGNHLSKGEAAVNLQMGMGLATYKTILKNIAKETLIQGGNALVNSAVSIGSDELSKIVMSEIIDKYFPSYFEDWLMTDSAYLMQKEAISEEFKKLYKKFDATEAESIINTALSVTLAEIRQGELAELIYDKVSRLADGVANGFSKAAARLGNKHSKYSGYLSMATLLSRLVTMADYTASFMQLCSIIPNFCAKLQVNLAQISANSQEKIQEGANKEDKSIVMEECVRKHINDMQRQMKEVFQEKIRTDFLKPLAQQALSRAMTPLQDALKRQSNKRQQELTAHIDKRAEKYLAKIAQQDTTISEKLTAKKKRALTELTHLEPAKNFDRNTKVANFGGKSLNELMLQHGDNVQIAQRNGKLYAVLPTYKQYLEHIKEGKYAGPMHIKLAADKLGCKIEIVDPSNFKIHHEAPNGEVVRPFSKKDSDKAYKIAYFKPEKEGEAGHYAPVIEVNGQLKVIHIKQDAKTNDKCLTQALLFLEKHNKGQIKEIKANHDYDITADDIAKFNKQLAKEGRAHIGLREEYHSGLTIKNSKLVGGTIDTVISWNQQGVSSDGDKTNKYALINNYLTEPDYGTRALLLQESGEFGSEMLPTSRQRFQNGAELQFGILPFSTNAVYIARYYKQGNRCNMAILSNQPPSEVGILGGGRRTHRPLLGMRIENEIIYNIHAISGYGQRIAPDVIPLLSAVATRNFDAVVSTDTRALSNFVPAHPYDTRRRNIYGNFAHFAPLAIPVDNRVIIGDFNSDPNQVNSSVANILGANFRVFNSARPTQGPSGTRCNELDFAVVEGVGDYDMEVRDHHYSDHSAIIAKRRR